MRRQKRTVEDFMSTAVISMKESDAVSSVRLEMNLADIRHIPIVDGQNHLVGIVSDRDLLRAIAKGGDAPVPIASVMKRSVRTVRPSTPAAQAVAIMLEHKIGSLPVVGEDEQLIGIVTETDFLEVAHQALEGRDVARSRLDM